MCWELLFMFLTIFLHMSSIIAIFLGFIQKHQKKSVIISVLCTQKMANFLKVKSDQIFLKKFSLFWVKISPPRPPKKTGLYFLAKNQPKLDFLAKNAIFGGGLGGSLGGGQKPQKRGPGPPSGPWQAKKWPLRTCFCQISQFILPSKIFQFLHLGLWEAWLRKMCDKKAPQNRAFWGHFWGPQSGGWDGKKWPPKPIPDLDPILTDFGPFFCQFSIKNSQIWTQN